MTSAVDRLARVRGLIAAFNRHDVEAVLACAADTARVRRGDGATLQGAVLANRLRDFFTGVTDARITPTHIVPFEGDAVLVEWRLVGTHLGPLRLPGRGEPVPATGRPVSFVGADLLTFDEAGAVVSDQTRMATATFLAQIGVGAPQPVAPQALRDFAESMTAAWCDHDAAGVAAHFALDASRVINAGPPAVGRGGIEANTQGFMTAVPDLELLTDNLHSLEDLALWCWTLRGTHSETGKWINISGFEIWQMGDDGLVANSRGYYDSAAYNHQVEQGADNTIGLT